MSCKPPVHRLSDTICLNAHPNYFGRVPPVHIHYRCASIFWTALFIQGSGTSNTQKNPVEVSIMGMRGGTNVHCCLLSHSKDQFVDQEALIPISASGIALPGSGSQSSPRACPHRPRIIDLSGFGKTELRLALQTAGTRLILDIATTQRGACFPLASLAVIQPRTIGLTLHVSYAHTRFLWVEVFRRSRFASAQSSYLAPC